MKSKRRGKRGEYASTYIQIDILNKNAKIELSHARDNAYTCIYTFLFEIYIYKNTYICTDGTLRDSQAYGRSLLRPNARKLLVAVSILLLLLAIKMLLTHV